MKLEGILAPVVTPFTPSDDVDLEGFASNIRAHVASGASGIVVTGSTGEAALLTEGERAALVERARSALSDDVALIVGIGAESTRATIARAVSASERGADAVLVVAPHYYGDQVTAVSLREHYENVADASPIPVLLYTIPKYMHYAIPADVVSRLAQHENIVGMKDSSGDATLFASYIESKSAQFKVLTGNGSFWCKALEMGADGGILAVSLFAPALTHEVRGAFATTDIAEARRLQERLTPLAGRIVGMMGVAGVKGAMDRVGLIGGETRPPLSPLAAPAQAMLDDLMSAAELTSSV